MEGDGVRQHGENIHDNLLCQVELVDIHGVEPSLAVGTAGKEQRIDVAQVALTGAIDDNGCDNGTADDPTICMCRLVKMEGCGGVTAAREAATWWGNTNNGL